MEENKLIAIIYISDIYTNPFLEKYINIIEKNSDYKIIYWNRKAKAKGIFAKGNIIEYAYPQDTNIPKYRKLVGFIKYRNFLYKNIKNHEYTKIVVLTTLTGLILYRLLLSKYKNKYIFDIRDSSYEYLPGFKKIISQIIYQSEFTCISSPGFKEILPSYNYIIANNFRYQDINVASELKRHFKKKTYGECLNLVYIGAIRQYEHIKKMIDLFGNDSRFILFYHGGGNNDYLKLKEYVHKEKISNIHFTGFYKNNEKYRLLSNADILNNHYELTYNIRYANSNKYWDGVIYRIPQFGNIGSHDGTLITEQNLGIALSLDSGNLPDMLYNYYFEINEKEFNNICSSKTKDLLLTDKHYVELINKFCESKNE